MRKCRTSFLWILLYLAVLFPNSGFDQPEHAIYLSLTEVKIKSVEASSLRIKVFSDDLQNALRNFSNDYQHGDLQHYFDLNRTLAEQYFQEHLKVDINDKPIVISLDYYSVENDAHFVTFLFQCPDKLEKLSVKADFLMELFPTQTNVVKVVHKEETSYLKCTNGNESQSLTWTH